MWDLIKHMCWKVHPYLWWGGCLISIAFICVICFTEWRPIECSYAEAGNRVLENLSFGFLSAGIFFTLNEYIPQWYQRKVARNHIRRKVRNIKEEFRLITSSIEPFRMGEPYTMESFTKAFEEKDLEEKYMDGSKTLMTYISEKKILIETICDSLLSSYGQYMTMEDKHYIDEILGSFFIRNNIVPKDFNVPDKYQDAYPNNQAEMGECIFQLYTLSKTH